MSKPKFDVELFWSLPRTEKYLVDDGKYCAVGSAYKACGYEDSLIKSFESSSNPLDFLGYRMSRTVFVENSELKDIYVMNDVGMDRKTYSRWLEIEKKSSENMKKLSRFWDLSKLFVYKPNPEKAKRMLIEYLRKHNLVEFVNMPPAAPSFAEEREVAGVE